MSTGDLLALRSFTEPHLPQLPTWKVFASNDDELNGMFKDWGIYHARKERYSTAGECFNKALDIKPNDANTLIRHSQSKRKQSLASDALIDAQKAQGILRDSDPFVFNPKVELEICDGFYESNRLEDAKRTLYEGLHLLSDTQSKPFLKRLSVVTSNIEDALSDETAPVVHRLINNMMVVDKSKHRTKKECDVLSIAEKELEFVSPLEIKRRKREFVLYNQNYLNKSWVDVSFLRKVRADPNLLLKQFVETAPYLEALTSNQYKAVRTFTKMLNTRFPLYCHNITKHSNHETKSKYQQESLFRLQYQTRRNMCQILRNIRNLIENKKLTKLTTYVEDVMGNYVTVKTNRIMPWKFEFINEVYNYLGLARINEFKIPEDLSILNGKQRLLALFKIPQRLVGNTNSRESKGMNINRTTIDSSAEYLKKLAGRYERRLRLVKYSIERSYLLHELAEAHLNNNSFDTCCLMAQKSMEVALSGKHYVWYILSAFVACKVYIILGKIEKRNEMLYLAFHLAKKLRNIDLCMFIDVCFQVNSEEFNFRKLRKDSRQKRRVHSSMDISSDTSGGSMVELNES